MKTLIDAHSDRILGFTAFGPEAGELMGTVQLAMLAGLPYTILRDAMFAHPTMTEGLKALFMSVPQQLENHAERAPTRANVRGLSRRLMRQRGTLSAAGSLRLHWPEYLMEAGESGLYLFSACAVATLLWHPASPIQRHLPSDAVRRMLDGPGDGCDHHRDRPFTVGQAVRSALQSRGHIHVLSIEESGVVGCGVLLRRAIARRGRRRGAGFACASRRAGAQSGPLRRHHTRHSRRGVLRQHHRVCCRTGHLVYLDERDPVRVQSRSPGALYTLFRRYSWLRYTSLSNLRYPG